MNSWLERLSAYIRNDSDKTLTDLLIGLFSYQYSTNLPYQRLCKSAEISPESITDWTRIPAVPATAFKLFNLSCKPLSECSSVFQSSGTTSESTSRHYMDGDALELYHISLTANFHSKFPNGTRLWAVMPSNYDAPRSSLSHMLATLGADSFAGADLAQFADALTNAAKSNIPIILFGTAFGLMELISMKSIPLPFGSIVIETGGFKGRFREIERSEFYGLLRDNFNVADENVHSEYGMCELASQFYSTGETGLLYGPHWVRTRCIDPLTNDDAAPGETGLLRIYDLANLNSVAVIQTQDLAVKYADGGFRLLGRASDAELRGCSLTAEELWSK